MDDVFREFRAEILQDSALEEAEQQYKLALAYKDMGMVPEAIAALELAARSPTHRFIAGALLARTLVERRRFGAAVEWFERAAEAPAPDQGVGRALLYDLGRALEASGEQARALAVFLELQADAGQYRDITTRIANLRNTK